MKTIFLTGTPSPTVSEFAQKLMASFATADEEIKVMLVGDAMMRELQKVVKDPDAAVRARLEEIDRLEKAIIRRGIREDIETAQELITGKSHKTPYVGIRKIPRNDPCPCGSGKKYKRCCLNTTTKR